MSRFEIILIIILVIIMIAYLSFMGYLMYNIYARNFSVKNISEPVIEKYSTPSSYQTDFFKKSIDHASKVLYGKAFVDQYGEPGFYGNNLMDIVSKLNDDTKKTIVLAMQYITLEPASARQIEKEYRIMAATEKVPLWFVILRESSKKMIPEFFHSDSVNSSSPSKIVSLFGNVA